MAGGFCHASQLGPDQLGVADDVEAFGGRRAVEVELQDSIQASLKPAILRHVVGVAALVPSNAESLVATSLTEHLEAVVTEHKAPPDWRWATHRAGAVVGTRTVEKDRDVARLEMQAKGKAGVGEGGQRERAWRRRREAAEAGSGGRVGREGA